jgi:hypothetical protein
MLKKLILFLSWKIIKTKNSRPIFYGFHPLLGFWGMANIEDKIIFEEFGGKVVCVQHNEDGNRDISYKPKDDLKSIVCLGGSHTWGGGIEAKFRYTDVFRGKIKNPVVNTGQLSLGLDQECLYILKQTKKYNPGVFVVEQYPWAVTRILNSYTNGFVKPQFSLNKEGGLKLKKVPKYARFKILRRIQGTFLAYKKELNEFSGGIDINQDYDRMKDPIFLHWKCGHYDYLYLLLEQLIIVMRDYCKQNNIHLIFALGAILQQFQEASPSELVDYDLPRMRLREILDKLEVAYVDMTEPMLASHSVDSPVILWDGHINEKGNEIFARVLEDELSVRGWL